MVGQLILRLELPPTHETVMQVGRIRRMDFHVHSKDSFGLDFQAANLTLEVPLRRVHMVHVRVEIGLAGKHFIAVRALECRFLSGSSIS